MRESALLEVKWELIHTRLWVACDVEAQGLSKLATPRWQAGPAFNARFLSLRTGACHLRASGGLSQLLRSASTLRNAARRAVCERSQVTTTTWKPSTLGKLLTRAPDWALELDGGRVRLTMNGETTQFDVDQLEGLPIKAGVFWARLIIPLCGANALELGGISNSNANQCGQAVAAAIAAKRHCDQIVDRVHATTEACQRQIARRGWLGREFAQRIESSKPWFASSIIDSVAGRHHLARQPPSVQDAVRTWERPFEEFVKEANERHANLAAVKDRNFFDQVEKSPLTEEQRKAVVCFDNRVLLVASAGSGKTSTMVAKAGYALRHGYFSPERMLLLAFNTDAASELRERIRARLDLWAYLRIKLSRRPSTPSAWMSSAEQPAESQHSPPGWRAARTWRRWSV